MPEPLLKIKNLKIRAYGDFEYREIIKGLTLEVKDFQIVALVGGSGSGKTTAGLSILSLLPAGLTLEGGEIWFKDENLLNLSNPHMRRLRGKEIAMVFQEPLSALNPVFSIGFQIEEVIRFHAKLKRRERKEKVLELLSLTGISDPRRIAKSYPHQLSGGMRQRAMIAQAIAAQPKLIIADEPTSNLDVTLQAHIIHLLRKLKEELGISILLITHDLGVVRHLADKVGVLFDGRIVEFGDTAEIL